MESKKNTGASALPTDFLALENDTELMSQIDEDGNNHANKYYRVFNIFS